MRPSNNLENKAVSDTYCRIQLVCVKVQAGGAEAFDESRFIMTFLAILGDIAKLCSFRLVLEGKTSKEILESSRLEFLEKFLANNFALSDAEDNTSWMHQTSREPCFWQVMDSCFSSICKFGSFWNPFAMITNLPELYFRFRFILLLQKKKWFLWTMAAAQSAENHGDEWGLTWYLRWGI